MFKTLEYERHCPKNGVTAKMWDRLFSISATGAIDQKSIIPSYWAKWKKDSKEGAIFITEAKAQVAEGFDLIAGLESKKIKEGNTRIAAFIKN